MLEGVVIDDTNLFNDKLRVWEPVYNFDRPRGSLGGQTLHERLRQNTTTRVSTAYVGCAPRARW